VAARATLPVARVIEDYILLQLASRDAENKPFIDARTLARARNLAGERVEKWHLSPKVWADRLAQTIAALVKDPDLAEAMGIKEFDLRAYERAIED